MGEIWGFFFSPSLHNPHLSDSLKISQTASNWPALQCLKNLVNVGSIAFLLDQKNTGWANGRSTHYSIPTKTESLYSVGYSSTYINKQSTIHPRTNKSKLAGKKSSNINHQILSVAIRTITIVVSSTVSIDLKRSSSGHPVNVGFSGAPRSTCPISIAWSPVWRAATRSCSWAWSTETTATNTTCLGLLCCHTTMHINYAA